MTQVPDIAKTWQVQSKTDKDTLYTVKQLASICPHTICSSVSCEADECQPLCRHLFQCSCFGYQNGHLCKHVHKLQAHLKAGSKETGLVEIDPTEPMEVKVNIPAKPKGTAGKS